MRKLLVVIIAVLLGSAAVAPAVHAARSTGDAKKACADVIEGRATYQSVFEGSEPIGADVLAQMDLGAWSCKNVSYTMTVLESETDPTVLETVAGVPNRPTDDPNVPPRVEFITKTPYPGPEGDVCLVITTAKKNGQVLDSAPNNGCVPVLIDSDVAGLTRFR